MPFTHENAAEAGRKGAKIRYEGLPRVVRDYSADFQREKLNYKRFTAKLKNEEAAILQEQLEREGVGFAQWVRLKLGLNNLN